MGGIEQKRKVIINTFFLLIIGVGSYVTVKYLIPLFSPFIFAFLFATLIHRAVKGMRMKSEKVKKWLALVMTGLFFLCIVLGIGLLGSLLMRLLERAVLTLPQMYEEEFVPWVYSIGDKLEKRYADNNPAVFHDIGNRFMTLIREIGENLSEISVERVENVSGYAKGIPSFFIKMVIMVVSTFFLAVDYEKITGSLFRLLPKRGKEMVTVVKKYSFEVFGAYLKSYSILMLLTFTELCIGLVILRIPYFVLISFCIALFDILPVLGTGGILIPWAAAAVIIGDYRLAAGLVLLDFVITVVRNILEPRIVGKQIGLHPMATLMALFIGLKIGGIVCMIGFPVCLSILVQLGKEGMLWYTEPETN